MSGITADRPGDGPATFLPNRLAKLVQERRLARGMTMEDVAAAAGFGRVRDKIATIISGHWPDHATLSAVIGVLDIGIAQIYPLPERSTTGKLLETMRLRRGLRLNDVGKAVGISGSQIRRIERDLTRSSPTVPRLLAWFGVEHVRTYPPEAPSPLASELERALRQRGLGPEQAARVAELDAMTIRLILRGHRPSFATATKLHEAFGVPLDVARPLDPEDSLAEQVRGRQWHSGLGAGDFARALGLSESSYTKIVANGVVGDAVAGYLTGSPLIAPEATQRAHSRHIERMLAQAGHRPPAPTELGRHIDERCIALGVLPGIVAIRLGINPATFRKIRRGALPERWERVMRIMDELGFSPARREDVRQEWERTRRAAPQGARGAGR